MNNSMLLSSKSFEPVLIAYQWHKNGDHPNDYVNDLHGFEGGKQKIFSAKLRKKANWEGEVVRRYRNPNSNGDTLCPDCEKPMHDHGWVSEKYIACPGDWVVRLTTEIYMPFSETELLDLFERANG